jgi:DNA-binding CsgD family transcriptional regulator
MKRKTKARAKAKRAVKDLTAKKAAKGGDVGTYTVSTHLRRIYSKLG